MMDNGNGSLFINFNFEFEFIVICQFYIVAKFAFGTQELSSAIDESTITSNSTGRSKMSKLFSEMRRIKTEDGEMRQVEECIGNAWKGVGNRAQGTGINDNIGIDQTYSNTMVATRQAGPRNMENIGKAIWKLEAVDFEKQKNSGEGPEKGIRDFSKRRK